MNKQDRELLAQFLRSRREQLQPGQVGIVDNRRRRAKGLKREEVSVLAGISLTWYTWIEQARDVNFSEDVLAGIADALQLQTQERQYIYQLCGIVSESVTFHHNSLDSTLMRLIDSQNPFPAYAMGHYWQLLYWNQSAEALFNFDSLQDTERNILWYTFSKEASRSLVMNWEERAKQLVNEFRADCSQYLNDPLLKDFLKRLQSESLEFKKLWSEHQVKARDGGRRDFQHLIAGHLVFEQTTLGVSHAPDIKIVIHLPLEESCTMSKLKQLIAENEQKHNQ